VVVTVAVDISVVVFAMGDCFLGKKVCPRKMGMTGIADLLNSELGHDRIGVLILKCQIRVEIGSGLSVSNSDSSGLVGLFPPVCLSLE
jgi:hypothetical protein